MKLFANIIPLGLVATAVKASPVTLRDDMQIYKLTVSCITNGALDGQQIKLNASTLGIYTGDNYATVQVYPAMTKQYGLFSLHTYPIGVVDHALSLENGPGLFDFVDIMNPAGASSADDWETFRMSDGHITNDGEGQWLAFPDEGSSWLLKWSDGSAFMTEDYVPVEVKYQKLVYLS